MLTFISGQRTCKVNDRESYPTYHRIQIPDVLATNLQNEALWFCERLRWLFVKYSRCGSAHAPSRPTAPAKHGGSPSRRRFFVDYDLPTLDRDIPSETEILENAADHLPGSADPVGQVLVGKILRNYKFAVQVSSKA